MATCPACDQPTALLRNGGFRRHNPRGNYACKGQMTFDQYHRATLLLLDFNARELEDARVERERQPAQEYYERERARILAKQSPATTAVDPTPAP